LTEAILHGFGTGMLFSVMLGTVFFSIIQNSIDNGLRSGIFISLGVIVSDIVLIFIAYFNANLIPESGAVDVAVRITGCGLLIFLGLFSIIKKRSVLYPKTNEIPFHLHMANGFLLNSLNPGNFFQWIVVSAYAKNTWEFEGNTMFVFYVFALLAIFCTETVIATGASLLKKFINEKVFNAINMVTGIIFVVLGLWLLKPIFV